jgi:large subunit ribosomal protein L6
MSRIGRKPVVVPANVKITYKDLLMEVEGPKGKLSFRHSPEIDVAYDEATRVISVTRRDDERQSRALHGVTRSLIANMVQGVTEGYTKKLEIVGVGYQAEFAKAGGNMKYRVGKEDRTMKVDADTLGLQVGYANKVLKPVPEGLTVTVPDPTHITITGADKQLVGQYAAEVRKVRVPEPYKGKGIRYEGEVVRRKAGKAFGSK